MPLLQDPQAFSPSHYVFLRKGDQQVWVLKIFLGVLRTAITFKYFRKDHGTDCALSSVLDKHKLGLSPEGHCLLSCWQVILLTVTAARLPQRELGGRAPPLACTDYLLLRPTTYLITGCGECSKDRLLWSFRLKPCRSLRPTRGCCVCFWETCSRWASPR